MSTVVQWDFLQTTVEIAPIALAGQGGGIFGSAASAAAPRLPAGTEVRIEPFNRTRRRSAPSLRGVIVDNHPTRKEAVTRDDQYLVKHREGVFRVWTLDEVFPMSELELLAESGETP